MIEQKFGRIINITSLIGQGGGFGQANYAASKGGVTAFTKTLALEMAKFNITANCIAPGYTETDMVAAVPEAVLAKIRAMIPLGRPGKPEDIAKAVAFLATGCRLHHRTGTCRQRWFCNNVRGLHQVSAGVDRHQCSRRARTPAAQAGVVDHEPGWKYLSLNHTYAV